MHEIELELGKPSGQISAHFIRKLPQPLYVQINSSIFLPISKDDPILPRHTNFDVGKKVAIVTGAGQGMGEAFAKTLASNGASVAVCDINYEAAQQVSSGISSREPSRWPSEPTSQTPTMFRNSSVASWVVSEVLKFWSTMRAC